MKRYIISESELNDADTLITTVRRYFWMSDSVKRKYFADLVKDARYSVYLRDKYLGRFRGVFRTFEDNYYYVEYYDESGEVCDVYVHGDAELILEPIH